MTVSSVKTGELSLSFALNNNFMEPIATTLVGSGGTNNITFNDIPQTYKHLQLRYISRNSPSADDHWITLNGDSGVSYAYHRLSGNGSTVSVLGRADQRFFEMPTGGYSSLSSGVFGAGIIDILDYSNTNKYKTIRMIGGVDSNGSGYSQFLSALWQKTDPIISITANPNPRYDQYSRFSLYGIKG